MPISKDKTLGSYSSVTIISYLNEFIKTKYTFLNNVVFNVKTTWMTSYHELYKLSMNYVYVNIL